MNEAAKLLRSAGFPLSEIGGALQTVWGATPQVLGAALKGAEFAVNEVGDFLKSTFNLAPQALKSALEGAGYAANEVGGFLKGLGGGFASLVTDIGKKIGNVFKKLWPF